MENNQEEKEKKVEGVIVFNEIMSSKAAFTVEKIKNELLMGNTNPSFLGVALKKFHKIYEDLKEDKEAMHIIETDLKKFQEGTIKTFEVYGAKITIANRGYWDFSLTQDPLLERLKEIEKTIKEQIKSREKELTDKAETLEKRNTPTNGGLDFKVKSYSVSWDELPVLSWEEAIGELETLPPIKRGSEQFRYSV